MREKDSEGESATMAYRRKWKEEKTSSMRWRTQNYLSNLCQKLTNFNENISFWTNLVPRSSGLLVFLFFKTILVPTSVSLIFYAPNVANLGFWRIVPTIAL